MHHGVWIPKAGPERFAEIDMSNLFGSDDVHKPKLVDEDGHCARSLANAEVIEGMKCIRSKLNAGTFSPKAASFSRTTQRMPSRARLSAQPTRRCLCPQSGRDARRFFHSMQPLVPV